MLQLRQVIDKYSKKIRASRKARIALFASVFLSIGSLTYLCIAGPRGVPAQDGIVNFGKVSDLVYRGAQPDALGMQNLKKLGVKTIINLRMVNDAWKDEAQEALNNGIAYTNIPLQGLGRPKDDDIKTILSIIASSTSPVFIHCQHGCDRTGTIVACYRIQHDHWSSDIALLEAKKYGMSVFERGMRRFVVDFGKAAPPVPTQVAAKKL
ncbi:MAG: hypothetical protein C5B50_11975 [Verrucomicrobia bacterium]|nr:MAG: hypothetical protein C5B50_11975 [Verrucomicrobiota bacterium]